MQRWADRIDQIEPFRVVEILTRARELQAQGRDILHLAAGEPDFATAKPICDAAIAALRAGHTYYTPAAGMGELRRAIAGWYQSQYGVDVAPERIFLTPGASGAILLLAGLLLNPGDGILLTDPGYPCNRQIFRMVEGEGQLVPVSAADRYQLTGAAIDAHWRANTIGAMVASPANPTGEVLRRSELEDLWQAVQRHRGHLIVDEIYHGLDYEMQAPTILSVTEQAFVVNSFSKYFGMTGWRLGWLVAPEWALPGLEKLAQNLFISLSTPAQYGALACFEPDTIALLNDRRDEFRRRRDYLLPELRKLGFTIEHTPAGGYYLYAGIDAFSDDSEQFCRDLLEQHGVAITPGTDFGEHLGRRHVRFAYTTSMAELEQTVARLQRVYS
jgi:aspartate/methionine/tyrosine aminotransferase